MANKLINGRNYLLCMAEDYTATFYATYNEKFNLFHRFDVMNGVELFHPKEVKVL
jgi:hypothetical protein